MHEQAYRERYIQCPYCGGSHKLICPRINDVFPREIEALPYARDVGKFDPKEGQPQSGWTKIGEDFLAIAGWNYERIGILRMKRGWHVAYCVARCSRCQALIDVYANFVKDKSLSEIWPHLLARDKLEDPDNVESRTPAGISSDNFFVILFFVLIYLGSVLPLIILYAKNPISHNNEFLAYVGLSSLVHGIATIYLIFLFLRRNRLIKLIRNEGALSRVFKLTKREKGVVYWSNFAVYRLVGYGIINPVMLFGGLFSSLILIFGWILVRLSSPPSGLPDDLYVMLPGLVFWLVMSYFFGIVAWNFSEGLSYIFHSIQKIPMNVHGPHIQGFEFIEQLHKYYVHSLYLLILFVLTGASAK